MKHGLTNYVVIHVSKQNLLKDYLSTSKPYPMKDIWMKSIKSLVTIWWVNLHQLCNRLSMTNFLLVIPLKIIILNGLMKVTYLLLKLVWHVKTEWYLLKKWTSHLVSKPADVLKKKLKTYVRILQVNLSVFNSLVQKLTNVSKKVGVNTTTWLLKIMTKNVYVKEN